VWREKIPYLLLAVAAASAALYVQRTTGYLTEAEPAARVVMVLYNVWFHVGKTFAPLDLSPIYELPMRLHLLERPYLLSAIGSLALTVAACLLRRRWPAGLAVWAFYLVMLAPVSGVVHTGNHLGADRNTYLPCAGFALLIGALVIAVVQAWRRGMLRAPIAALALGLVAIWIAGFAVAARIQTAMWHDSETLWRHAIEVEPTCAICLHNLAVNLGRRGDQAQSLTLFERAIALRPDQSEFRANYGLLLLQMGRRQEGQAELRSRLASNPGDVTTRTNLAIALIEDGHIADAVAELEQALRLKPDSVHTLNTLGRARFSEGRFDEAAAAFERAIAVDPSDPLAHVGLARTRLARGDRAGAQAQLEILKRIDARLFGKVEQEFR
jgi:Flp pilus assembly protein TadD